MAQILSYDASSGVYTYKDVARFLTNILATSPVPLVDPT
jgi:hypothetical protein